MDGSGSDGEASNLSRVAAKSKARTLPSKRRARRAWAVLAIVAVSIGFLLYKGLGNSLVYFRTAAGAWKDRAQLGNSTFRLEGVVVPGSIHTLNGGVDFAVESSNVSVEVHDTANPPPAVPAQHSRGAGGPLFGKRLPVHADNGKALLQLHCGAPKPRCNG